MEFLVTAPFHYTLDQNSKALSELGGKLLARKSSDFHDVRITNLQPWVSTLDEQATDHVNYWGWRQAMGVLGVLGVMGVTGVTGYDGVDGVMGWWGVY